MPGRLTSIDEKLNDVMRVVLSLEQKLRDTETRLDSIQKVLRTFRAIEHSELKRANGERMLIKSERGEHNEHGERSSTVAQNPSTIVAITGRHRQVLSVLINEGFHTYEDLAQRLVISQSRARAYIAELKKVFNVPLRHVRDAEGYKVGIDTDFVERILAAKA